MHEKDYNILYLISNVQEIYNSQPQIQKSKNEHYQNSEVPKEVWNSKPNILNHSKVENKKC